MLPDGSQGCIPVSCNKTVIIYFTQLNSTTLNDTIALLIANQTDIPAAQIWGLNATVDYLNGTSTFEVMIGGVTCFEVSNLTAALIDFINHATNKTGLLIDSQYSVIKTYPMAVADTKSDNTGLSIGLGVGLGVAGLLLVVIVLTITIAIVVHAKQAQTASTYAAKNAAEAVYTDPPNVLGGNDTELTDVISTGR